LKITLQLIHKLLNCRARPSLTVTSETSQGTELTETVRFLPGAAIWKLLIQPAVDEFARITIPAGRSIRSGHSRAGAELREIKGGICESRAWEEIEAVGQLQTGNYHVL
jgi:hypothetical protein